VTSWKCVPFRELTTAELYEVLRVRAEVFVVEQACAFQDMDGADQEAWHLMGFADLGPGLRRGDQPPGRLVAYARLIPAGIKFAEPSIGRVITTAAVRGTGAGRELMQEALRRAEKLFPGKAIRIGAQQRLERFYHSLGFATASEPYDEDGIPHVEMLRPASKVPDKAGQPVGQ
jgi:ElaA protein